MRMRLFTLARRAFSASPQLPAVPAPYDRLAQNMSPAIGRFAETLVVEKGRGCRVYTVGGDARGYLDFTSGIGVTSTGHCHPHVVKAIQEQAAQVLLTQASCYLGAPTLKLTEKLLALVPRKLDSLIFTNSGSEAVENAVKLARAVTGRNYIICYEGAFHGRLYMSMAMTLSRLYYRQRFGQLPGGIDFAPFPYSYRYKVEQGLSEEQTVKMCLNQLEFILHTRCPPEETAAIVIEPIQGEGGYIPCPPSYLQGLRKICDKHGILLVADEVQSGFARSGRMWAHEEAGIEPDMIVMAKGIASGMPLAAIAAPRSFHDKLVKGSVGGTYNGNNAVAIAAASATIDVIKSEGLIENAGAQGDYLMQRLRELQRKYPVIGDVRGRGLMVGVEFTTKDGKPDANTVTAMKPHLIQNRLLLLVCGLYGNVYRWVPPLVVTRAEIDEGLEIFEKALKAVSA